MLDILFFAQPTGGNFLVKIIIWLASISSSIAVAVVLFTVLLKLITLPFDYISRSSMRKNSLKMEEMRPELEKLQQQYANDKALYQQKMMALYKKNGYSMFGACLPTIITLVIFIVALNAFTNFSKFQNRQYFYDMSKAYNNVIYAGMELDAGETEYITRNLDGELVIQGEELYKLCLANADGVSGTETITGVKGKNQAGEDYSFDISLEIKNGANEDLKELYVFTTNSYISAKLVYGPKANEENPELKELDFANPDITFDVVEEKLTDAKTLELLASEENNYMIYYPVDQDGNKLLDQAGNEVKWTYEQAKLNYTEEYFNIVNKNKIEDALEEIEELKEDGENYDHIVVPTYSPLTAKEFLLDIRQQRSADTYHDENPGFLWVKNIWVTDSPLKNPVEDDWDDFKSTHGYEDKGHVIDNDDYVSLTAKLEYEKNAPNGYFILVILTAGTSLLMQLIMSKSQKAQMELQTVDGQGAKTQKIMTIIMPIMMAVFAFMYTSAFSIYIILSSVISIGTTLGINKIVDIKFKKAKAKKEKNTDTKRIRGRVYVPKKEEIVEEPKKSKKDKKKAPATPTNDFLSGKADGKKHIRGRLK